MCVSPFPDVHTMMYKHKELLQGIINTTLMDHMWNQDSLNFETSNTNHSKEVRICHEPCVLVTASFC